MLRRVTITILIFCFCACKEFTEDTPVESNLSSIGQQFSLCQIDADRLNYFFEKEISVELDCLKSSLNKFNDYVKTEHIGKLYKKDLLKFTKRFYPEQEGVSKGLDMLFLSYQFLWATEENFIDVSDLDKLFEIIGQFNKTLSKIYPIFFKSDNISEDVFLGHKKIIFQEALNLKNILIPHFTKIASPSKTLSVDHFLEKIRSITTPNVLEQISNLALLKKMFFGGNKKALSQMEIVVFLGKYHHLLDSIHTIIKQTHIEEIKEQDRFLSYSRAIDVFMDSLAELENSSEYYLTIEDLIEVIYTLSNRKYDFSPFIRSVKKVKTANFIGGDEFLKKTDIAVIGSLVKEILFELSTVSKIWDRNKNILRQKRFVLGEELKFIHQTELERKVFLSFKKFIQTYKYLNTDKGIALYDYEYSRSKSSILEIWAYRYLIEIFFREYGFFDQDSRSYKLKESQFLHILNYYEDMVTENGLWRNPIEKVAENALAMNDFFRHTANGNGVIDIKEATDYMIMELNSFKMEKPIFDGLKEKCQVRRGPTRTEKLSVECVEREFFHVLKNVYGDLFPALFRELKVSNYVSYFKKVSNFARQCPFKSIDMRKKDITLILGGMISIEEVYLNIDKNTNGILEKKEINDSLKVFKKALEVAARGGKPMKNSQAKGILFYLIKTGKNPMQSLGRFLWFFVRNKLGFGKYSYIKVKGDRESVANILSELREIPEDIPSNIDPDCYAEPYPLPDHFQSTRKERRYEKSK